MSISSAVVLPSLPAGPSQVAERTNLFFSVTLLMELSSKSLFVRYLQV
jgi:hypothetical protein